MFKKPLFDIQWSKLFSLLVAFVLLVIAAFSSYSHLQAVYFDRAEENLKSQIGTLHQSLSAWGRSERNAIYSWSKQPEVVKHVRVIINGTTPTVKKLNRFALSDYLRPAVSNPEITHFYLIGPGNTVVASDNPQSLGQKTHLMATPYLLEQAWGGMSVISHPIRPLNYDQAAIFVAAAIMDATSSPIALLVFEINPGVSFNEIFKKSAFSETGEAYAFGQDGVMLTPARHHDFVGLNVTTTADSTSLGDLAYEQAQKEQVSVRRTPLASAVGDESFALYVQKQFTGHDGEQKIGAWVWDKQFHMGIALEQSAREGLQFLQKMQWVFLSFIALVLLISVGFFFVLSYWTVQRTKREEQAREALTQELQLLHKSSTVEMADREARHRAIIDTAWDAIFTVDAEGVIRSGNPATARIFGCSQDKLIGHLLEDAIWLEGKDKFCSDYLDAASGQTVEAIGIRHNRSTFPVAVSIGATQTSQSYFFTVIVRDISQQKASEASLVRAQNRLEMSQAFAFIGTWEWDIEQDQITATEMALKLNGLDATRERVSLGAFFSKIFPDDRVTLNHQIHQSIQSQTPFTVECRIFNYDGPIPTVDWLLIQGTPLAEFSGATRLIGHIQRVTQNKHSEQALEAARNMLRLVLDTIPTGVYWKNTDLKIAGVNKKYCDDIGLSEQDIIGKTERDLYQDKSQAILVERLDQTVMETGIAQANQNDRYLMREGRLRHIEISRLPIQDERKNTVGMLGVYSDITERLETQKNLQRHHQMLASIYSAQLRYFAGDEPRAIFSALLDEILGLTESEYGFIGQVLYHSDGLPYLKTFSMTDLTWDQTTREQFEADADVSIELSCQEALLRTTLLEHELLISNDPAADFAARTLPEAQADLQCFLGAPLLKGCELVGMIGLANRKSGYEQELATLLQPMFTTCANLIAALDNDAKIVATQKQLLRAKNTAEQANRAKTEFLSRVSHELRTPMNAILGFTRLLTDSIEDSEHQSFLEEIDKAGGHLMSLINEVLDLERIESGRIELQIEKLLLDQLLNDCYSVTSQLAAQQNIRLTLCPANEQDLFVLADASRLRQIMLNLISNAIKYNRPQGCVEISVRSTQQRVYITVEDSGVGLTADEVSHLFESFNRLHAESSDIEGTGMGLVITKHLAELMGGELSVISHKGEGSRFTLALPLESLSLGVTKPSANAQRSQRALIVSSHRLMSEFCPELETQLINYELEFVETGIAFLEACLQQNYQLLICDAAVNDLALDELLAYLLDAEVLQTMPLLIVVDSTPNNLPKGLLAGDAAYKHIKLHRIGSPAAGLVQDLVSAFAE